MGNKKVKINKGIIVLISIVVLFFITFSYVFCIVSINGNSMSPTLEDGAYAVTLRLSLKGEEIERYDVVVYKDVNGSEAVKRVIALPNETILYKDDKLYINGRFMEEPFLDDEFIAYSTMERKFLFTNDFGPITLNKDEYFLLGDNRLVSKDSRVLGAVTKEDILGEGIFIVYPFSKWGN